MYENIKSSLKVDKNRKENDDFQSIHGTEPLVRTSSKYAKIPKLGQDLFHISERQWCYIFLI